jgi:hypothetical protein
LKALEQPTPLYAPCLSASTKYGTFSDDELLRNFNLTSNDNLRNKRKCWGVSAAEHVVQLLATPSQDRFDCVLNSWFFLLGSDGFRFWVAYTI